MRRPTSNKLKYSLPPLAGRRFTLIGLVCFGVLAKSRWVPIHREDTQEDFHFGFCDQEDIVPTDHIAMSLRHFTFALLTLTALGLVSVQYWVISPSSRLTSDIHDINLAASDQQMTSLATSVPQYELMTPALIAHIKESDSDPLSPIQVHTLWIGDIAKIPSTILQYETQGFNLTVHTSAEEILDGFHPYVLNGFKLAIPSVVGFDFLKLAMLYKYGGLIVDADTTPGMLESQVKYPRQCDIVFGKEVHFHYDGKPIYRRQGGNTYMHSRPYQILNWAMVAAKPRNKHIKYLLDISMMHFFGLRDMEFDLIQDIAGSGLMSDYFALLCERYGIRYPELYATSKMIPVDGMCLLEDVLSNGWIRHSFLGTWKQE